MKRRVSAGGAGVVIAGMERAGVGGAAERSHVWTV